MFYTCGGGHCLHARRTCNCSWICHWK
jgi:hypothetical protein